MKTEFNTSFPWLDCQYDGAPSKVIFSGGGVSPDAGCGQNVAAVEVERAVVESPVLVVGWDSRRPVIEPPQCPFGNGGDEEERRGWLQPVSRPVGHLRSTPPRGHPYHATSHRLGGPQAAAGARWWCRLGWGP
jgi:hypothetical protein